MTAKSEGKTAFIPFITFGYPDIETSEALIRMFSDIGVTCLELGLPFSDPVADGPVIQQASYTALKNGVTLEKLVASLKKMRAGLNMPVAVMTYYNLLLGPGLERFFSMTGGLVDGLIIPDLLPEEAAVMRRLAAGYDMDTVFFIAPTTEPGRYSSIDRASSGFVYYVSVTGTTGARREFDNDVFAQLADVRGRLTAPVCAGFGISTPDHVRAFTPACDGVIVGSAFMKTIAEAPDREEAVERARRLALWLMNG